MKRIFLVSITAALALGFGVITVVAAEFSDWSTPVNLGPVVNSPYDDQDTAISKNGLSLFFSSNRHNPTDPNDLDLYVSKRDSIDAPWGPPVRLTMLSSPGMDLGPGLSLDEHRLYFVSTRPGGCGGWDLWVSRRHDRRDDFGWESPVNLGCEEDGYVNSPYDELGQTFFEDDEGRVLMYFSPTRPDPRVYNIYQSEMRDDDTFGPATPVTELNVPRQYNLNPTVRRDGLEVIFLSSRGCPGCVRFWAATRESTSDPWSEPVLVESLSLRKPFARITLSFDGRELYFSSKRDGGSGGADLWVTRREKLQGKKE